MCFKYNFELEGRKKIRGKNRALKQNKMYILSMFNLQLRSVYIQLHGEWVKIVERLLMKAKKWM